MSLLVVGSLHLDVVLTAPHLPAIDETVAGHAVAYVFGGKGGNQALAAARLGADVTMAGRAGSDPFGDMIRETLQSSGIDLAQLQRDPGPSGMSAAIVNAQGDYGAVIVSAANLNIEAEAISLPDTTQLVLLQNEIPDSVNLAVARKAKACGAQVWLNGAPARALPDALIDCLDLLIVNRVEAAFYAEIGTAVEVLTTLGSEGATFRGDLFPAFQVDVVSTHGAGDTFVGALAAEILAGAEILEAIRFAQGAAAMHVTSTARNRENLTAGAVRQFLAAQDKR